MKHECDEYQWKLAANEEGWECVGCGKKPGEPPGYSPQLDVKNITEKVADILLEMTESNLIHISNGSEGDVLTEMVANRCGNENRYDQYSIVHFIMDLEAPDHAEYWRKASLGILGGNDPRGRCDTCGKLATGWCRDKKACADHYDNLRTVGVGA